MKTGPSQVQIANYDLGDVSCRQSVFNDTLPTIELKEKIISHYCKEFRMTSSLMNRDELKRSISSPIRLFCWKPSVRPDDIFTAQDYYNQSSCLQQQTELIVLHRQHGVLGFSIAGGYVSDDHEAHDGLVVSRLIAHGAAHKSGLRMHDKIVKVNGHDLTSSTHEEAVDVFRSAREPIVVEVLRKRTKDTGGGMRTPPSPPVLAPMLTVATQTEDDCDMMTMADVMSPSDNGQNGHGSHLVEPACRRGVAFSAADELGLTDLDMANDFEYDENFYDDERMFNIEYEEVTLRRLSSADKVGLTLCYGSADDEVTDIFISEIEPYSVAAKDGHIHEGDQILQINGVDVNRRQQAIELFATSYSDIRLLLARPQNTQADDGFAEETAKMDSLHRDILKQKQSRGKPLCRGSLLDQTIDEEGATTDTATTENSSQKLEKDSGVGRTDGSTRNDESSEQELPDTECTSLDSKLWSNGHHHHNGMKDTSPERSFTNDSFSTQTPENGFISAEQCANFQAALRSCYNAQTTAPHCGCGQKRSQLPCSNLEQQILALNREMERFRMSGKTHCGRDCSDAVVPESAVRSPARMVPRMGTRLEYNRLHSADAQDTGGGRKQRLNERTQPVALQLTSSDNSPTLTLLPHDRQTHSDPERQTVLTSNGKEWRSDSDGSHKSVSRTSQTANDNGETMRQLYAQYAEVMYTNEANLQHTIHVQQQLFQQQRAAQQAAADAGPVYEELPDVPAATDTNVPAESSSKDEVNGSCAEGVEWVVKKRSDGSRYITRRPVRSQLLRARARRIAAERSGVTTDDDAASELKVGRYWRRDERREHLDRARDHRRRKQQLMQQQQQGEQERRNKPDVVQLGHRKMMRHKGRRILDDFMTIQEMLAHGTRDPTNSKTYNPLLSVTTV